MRRFLYLFATVSALVFSSCEHKDLCYDHPHTAPLQVIFDWSKAPEASPASMSLYLFPMQGKSIRNEFTDAAGGELRAAYGRYDVLCVNSDTEAVEYRNTDRYETFEVTTRTTTLFPSLSSLGVRAPAPPMAPGTEDERIAAAAGMLWGDHTEMFELSKQQTTLTLYPEVSVCSYTVEIRHAENLEHTEALSASLSGLSGGILIGADRLSEERVTVPFEVSVAGDRTTLTGGLTVFGHCPAEQTAHTLTVYAVLSDGSKWYYTYDVTDQIHSAPDPHNVHILLDGLPLPEPQPGGFNPSVGDWEEVEVDIDM